MAGLLRSRPLRQPVASYRAYPATTIYFIDDVTNTAKAYNINTGERITGQDVNLGVGDWKGGFREGNRWFFIDNFNNKLVAYITNCLLYTSPSPRD